MGQTGDRCAGEETERKTEAEMNENHQARIDIEGIIGEEAH